MLKNLLIGFCFTTAMLHEAETHDRVEIVVELHLHEAKGAERDLDLSLPSHTTDAA